MNAIWPVGLPDHLSATQVGLFERCPEAYRRRYLQKQRERVGGGLIVGHADHAAFEAYWKAAMDGVPLRLDDVEARYDAAFEQRAEEEDVQWGDTPRGKQKDRGVEMLRAYYPVARTVTPVAVEESFEYTTPRLPVTIRGKVDVETPTAVVERKRSSARKKTLPGKWRLQNMIYRSVRHKPVETHLSVETKTPVIVTPADEPALRSAYTPGVVDLTERYVGRIAQSMHAFYLLHGPDSPWPGALAHDWACGYCGYRPNCWWWEEAA